MAERYAYQLGRSRGLPVGATSRTEKRAGAAQGPVRPIDRSSPVPYYYQLQEILKEEIERGRWGPGDMLPSEAEISALFGISRTAIRKALDVLESDGQIYRVKGKGTIVARQKFRYEAVAAAENWIRADAVGRPTLHAVVEARRVTAGGHVGRLLQIDPQAEVFELMLAHAVGGHPTSLDQMFLRMDASPALAAVASEPEGLPRLDVGGHNAVAQLAVRYGLAITQSQVTVEATRVNEFESEQLGIRLDTPVFLLSSVDLRADGLPAAFTRSIARSDTFRFSVVIRREQLSGSMQAG